MNTESDTGVTATTPETGYPTRRVVVVERLLTHYRVAFYQRLRTQLAARNITLQLLIGHGTKTESQKQDSGALAWAIPLRTRYFFGNRLCWQPFGRHIRNADLVIVLHENKLLYNLWLLFVRRPRRLAFWGHGCNLQSVHPQGLREKFKRWTINRVDWWFAYTALTSRLLERAGFPARAVTVVDNAVDTAELTAWCRDTTPAAIAQFRLQVGLVPGPTGIFIGSLYHEKRLDFLLAAARRIRNRIPDFQLLVVGAGPQQALLQAAATDLPWLRLAGVLKGRDKAIALGAADVLLNPGLVGLGILDSFASGTPLFTTACGLHSPEIAYLESGRNGIMTADDIAQYADAVCNALLTPAVLLHLRQQALASAPHYTVDNMCARFCDGVTACLDQP